MLIGLIQMGAREETMGNEERKSVRQRVCKK